MVYFPLLAFDRQFQPSTTVYNFSPNNYQSNRPRVGFLYLHYTDGDNWHSYFIKSLQPGSSFTVTPDTFDFDIYSLNGTFLSFYASPIATLHSSLPKPNHYIQHTLPAWRASVSLSHLSGSSTSYQGEIFSFPRNSSFLSFNYFTQLLPAHNYLLFINLESSPSIRKSKLSFYRPMDSSVPFYTHQIFTNTINSIQLPQSVNTDDLICVKTDECSGIPLFFSYCPISSRLSLEHTHPPASLAIHGNRFAFQRILKQAWFNFLNSQ